MEPKRWGVDWPVEKPTGRVTIPLVPVDMRWKVAQRAWANTVLWYSRLLGKEYGWEKAAEITRNVWLGHSNLTVRYAERFKVPDKGAAKLSKILQYEWLCAGNDFDVVEERKEKAIFRSPVCNWWEELKRHYQEIPNEYWYNSCCIGDELWIRGMAKAIDPQLDVTLAKCLIKGDDYCDFVIEMRK